ncbi:MAG: 1-acyl-sn-glycerol-3-phosphate acyltransferase [Planctomycetota bacterium]|nr:MAG: 1-acyl-sn-glycerol-3-phosphate acyltransferase [Planctomycetota bacterium]
MQKIIIDRPYRFVPPHRGNRIPAFLEAIRAIDWYLYWFEGIHTYELRNVERLRTSLRAQRSIILAPNHCRYADPIAMGWLARAAGVYLFTVASWHLFNQNWLQSLAIRLCGGFSIYREGADKQSLDTAVEILVQASRPLVIFPEGTVYHTNDRLHPLLEGVSFVARTATRRRQKAGGTPVLIHPVAIKYVYRGDLQSALEPEVLEIERRLSWEDHFAGRDLLERILRVGEALFSLREIEYTGATHCGQLSARQQALIERLLAPLENHYLRRTWPDQPVIHRIKQLRAKIVPLWREARGAARVEYWNQIRATYVAQIIDAYDEAYLQRPTQTRVLETLERLQEDLTDKAPVHRPLHCIIEVGEAIEAPPDRLPRDQPDPVMEQLTTALQGMLDQLAAESPAWPTSYQQAMEALRQESADILDRSGG